MTPLRTETPVSPGRWVSGVKSPLLAPVHWGKTMSGPVHGLADLDPAQPTKSLYSGKGCNNFK
jgi:hypothetical protein